MKENGYQLKKRVITVVGVIIFIGIIYIFYCYISGIGVYKAVKYSFLTNTGYNEYISRYMSKDMFDSFNDYGPIVEVVNPKKLLKLYMLFSINDFFNKGKIWMYYSFEIIDKNNNIITGARNVPFTLDLKRDGWYWRILQRNEEP
jgi:hypothetical protein